VIETTGYTAALPATELSDEEPGSGPDRRLATRLAVCLPLAVAVIVLSMVPAAQFPGWQWVSLLLAGPVAVWGAWPLHRAAALGLGHGAATMDTLVSLGVSASLGWSVVMMFFGRAGALGMKMPFTLAFGAAGSNTIYLDVAAGVTVAVLAGRYLESRAKIRSAAPGPRWCSGTGPSCGSRLASWPPARSSWSGRASGSLPTVSSWRDAQRWTHRCSPASPRPPRSGRAMR
jgi:Cu+-exporting ATPase